MVIVKFASHACNYYGGEVINALFMSNCFQAPTIYMHWYPPIFYDLFIYEMPMLRRLDFVVALVKLCVILYHG